MNTTHYKQGSQTRYPRWNHFLAALFIAAMVMISTVPAFAVEATASTSTPDTEVSVPTSNLVENPADDPGEAVDSEPSPTSTSGPVSTLEELLDAIAHANANDVIELGTYITNTPTELVLGRTDCPVTIRRTTSEVCLYLGDYSGGNIKIQNITFDGAGIQSEFPFVYTSSPSQFFMNCNFVNCAGGSALEATGNDAHLSNCHFDNNAGQLGAHIRLCCRNTTIENCTFTGGFASDSGSVYMRTEGKTYMSECTISGNSAGTLGGGIYVEGGELSVFRCKIYGNTANGVANDITKDYTSLLSLADNYTDLVELYKSDGVVPNRWTVDSHYDNNRGTDFSRADMIFSMTFADNEPSPPPSPTTTSVTLDQSELSLYVGDTAPLTATLYPEGTSGGVQWTSSNPSVASVNESGFITAHSTGTTLITATAAVGRASASCLVTVQDAPATTYSISASATPVEAGTVSGSGQYEEGTTVTVTAVPNGNFRFLAWTEADTQISTEASLTFTVTSDRTLTAIFEPISEPAPGPTPKPTYTINASTAEGGTVSGGGEYEQGSCVTLTAIPESEYLFMGWTENGEQVSTDENFTFTAEQDRTLVANFELVPKPTYTVQVNSTQGGAAEGGGSYEEGEFITVNAVPDAGYRFLRWEENGKQVCTEIRYSFTAEANRTLIAVFELIPQSEPDSTHEPSYDPGIPTTSYRPSGNDAQPTATSLSSRREVQVPTLTNGKAVLIAPDDSFWGGYKAGRDNGMGTVTRADLAQLVYFMMDAESRKIYGVTQSPFRDVGPGTWYEAAVGTMQNTGIMVGCGDDLFYPDHTLTWGELLTVFARFTSDKPLTEYYTGEHWAKNAVNKAVTLGWLEYSEMFDPGSAVTTSEMVNLIQAVFRWSNE